MIPSEIESKVSSLMTRSTYRNHDTCKKDMISALTHYRGLTPKLENFIFNDGTRKELICLSGTIPVPYRGTSYNIPVSIWILDTHPLHAPMCYVCPTHDMEIRVSKHVDHTGKIYLPYLHEWNRNHSDIVGLIQICIITFSEQSPVFARTQAQATPPQPPQLPYPQHQPSYYPPVSSNSSSSYNEQTITSDHIRASLVSAVEDKVRRLLRDEFATKQVEIETLNRVKEELQQGENTLRSTLTAMNSELSSLQTSNAKILAKKQELEAAKEAINGNDNLSPDDIVQVPFPLYNQLLKAYAEDASDDDAMYYLGEALRRGVIDCDMFLKCVRNISRKQFFLRLTMQKCRKKANLET